MAAADSATRMKRRERRHLDLSLLALRVEGILTEGPRTPVRREVEGLGSVQIKNVENTSINIIKQAVGLSESN